VEQPPAYSPDLNPVEAIWSWPKYGNLANLVPRHVRRLDDMVREHRLALKCDPVLRQLWDGSELPFPAHRYKNSET
jgi:hypothetical protein